MGFLDELKDKAEEFGNKAKEGFEAAKDKTEDVIENAKDSFDSDDTPAEKAGQRDAAAASDAGQDVGDFPPVGATEPEVAAVEDATAGAAEQSTSGMGSESGTAASGDTSQDVGDFAPVGATEPEVAAVEDATAEAAEATSSTSEETAIKYTTTRAADTAQGLGEAAQDATTSATSSVDEALGSEKAAGDTKGDSELT
ncbi:MAG TPA: hypothetical protein VI094_19750 [Propionibacteriaceae bacterium]